MHRALYFLVRSFRALLSKRAYKMNNIIFDKKYNTILLHNKFPDWPVQCFDMNGAEVATSHHIRS